MYILLEEARLKTGPYVRKKLRFACSVSTLVPPYHSVLLPGRMKIVVRRVVVQLRVRRLWGCVRPAWGSHAVERERKRQSHRRSWTHGYAIRRRQFIG